MNSAPTAHAGTDLCVAVGSQVTLDGNLSSDPDGDPIAYRWTLTSWPNDSTATLAAATTARPMFTADVVGKYVATLVVNDGMSNSTPTTVAVTAEVLNAAPIADAGPPQGVTTGTRVTLDGSASTDADNDPLAYSWMLTGQPAGSAAELSSATAVRPTFVADAAGTYVAELIVSDGKVDSGPATVTVDAAVANARPVASAGIAQHVVAGATVTLDGTASSDADGDPLTYRWAIIRMPATSGAVLSSATSASPAFVANLAGSYVIALVVNDGKSDSTPSFVPVIAAPANAAPVADAGSAQRVVVGTVVTLDGSASSDANGDPLTSSWALVSKPASSVAVLASSDSVATTFAVDVAGDYVASLIVNDGQIDSAPATVMVTGTTGVPGQGTWETTLQPRDIDGDGVVDAYYDTTLNVIWLADASAAAGTKYDTDCSTCLDHPTTVPDGRLYWYDARRWAANLNVHGVKGWRLPTTIDESASESKPPPPHSSEMAWMYYVTLGNRMAPSATPNNTGPFSNLRAGSYWSGTRYSLLTHPDEFCWAFNFASGRQGWAVSAIPRYHDPGQALAAWAVRDGDVPTAP